MQNRGPLKYNIVIGTITSDMRFRSEQALEHEQTGQCTPTKQLYNTRITISSNNVFTMLG